MKMILIVATSLDGFIAQSREQISTSWTSQEDKQWFNLISREIKILLMGRTTYETIGKPLPGRTTIVMSREADLVGAVKIEDFVQNSEQNLYVTGDTSPQSIVQLLSEKNLEKIAICGGAYVYQKFLEAGLIDELYLTIEPVFLGGGVKLLAENTNLKFPLHFQVVEKINLSEQTTVLHLKKGTQPV